MEYENLASFLIISLLVILGVAILNPIVFIGAGKRGVVMNFGAVQNNIMQEGLNFKTPFVQSVKEIDIRVKKVQTGSSAASKDMQTVNTEIALNYSLDANNVNKLYQQFGDSYEENIIAPAIQESIKASTAKYTAEELIAKREDVKSEIKQKLIERLGNKFINVLDVSIINFDFSAQFNAAIEAKQTAVQQAMKAENDIKRVKMEAEQRIAQAEAEAKAIRLQSDAANSENYVQLKALEVQMKAVERWNGQLPMQMIPNATLPFVNLTR